MSDSSSPRKGKGYTLSDKPRYGCGHFHSWKWDTHDKCVYCLVKLDLFCSREHKCDVCSEWSVEQWDLYESKVQAKLEAKENAGPSPPSKKRKTSESSISPKKKQTETAEHDQSPAQSSADQISSNGIPSAIGDTRQTPSSQGLGDISFMQNFMGMVSFFGKMSAMMEAPGSQAMVRPPPDTSRKGGNSGACHPTYGQELGNSGAQTDTNGLNSASLAQTSLETSGSLFRDPNSTGQSSTPASQGSSLGQSQWLPHVCGALRPQYSESLSIVSEARQLQTSTTPAYTTRVSASVSRPDPSGSVPPQSSGGPSAQLKSQLKTRSQAEIGEASGIITSQAAASRGDMERSQSRLEYSENGRSSDRVRPSDRSVDQDGDRHRPMFNTDSPPVLPLDHGVDQQAEAVRVGSAVEKLQEALAILPQEKQESISDLFKKLLTDTSSIGSTVIEQDLEDEKELQDPGAGSFTDMWTSMASIVRDFVPSLPETKLSPVKRRRISAAIDKDEVNENLPMHPNVESVLDACMREVKDSKDRAEPLAIGKYLKTERSFPKRQWVPPNKPKVHLPSIRVNRSFDQLISGVRNVNASLTDVELAIMETQVRESVLAISNLKWVFEAQSAFVQHLLPENAGEDLRRIPHTIDNSVDFILTYLLDQLSVQLSNIVLRRRDLVLQQADKMSQSMVTDLRAQPVLQSELIEVQQEVCERQVERLERQAMVQSLSSTVLQRSHPPFRGSQKRGLPASRAGRGRGGSNNYSTSSTRGRGAVRGWYKSRRAAYNSTRGRGTQNPATSSASSSSSSSSRYSRGKKQ